MNENNGTFRLTKEDWQNFDASDVCGQHGDGCKRTCNERGGCRNGCIVPKLYARLAAFEDLGVTPEQVMAMQKTN